MHMNLSMRMLVFGHKTTGKCGCAPSSTEPVESSTRTEDVRAQKAVMVPSSRPEPACTTTLWATRSVFGGHQEMVNPSSGSSSSTNSVASFPVPAM